MVRYDNEAGKVDHRHLEESEKPARRGKADKSASLGCASPELLWKVLTTKRWEILKVMTGAGPMSIREIARRVERDVKAVHSDVHALLNTGILDRTEGGEIGFPYEAVHVNFTLYAAA